MMMKHLMNDHDHEFMMTYVDHDDGVMLFMMNDDHREITCDGN